MPIYEYICASCGERCEILQKVSEPAPDGCPSCGRDALKKMVSAAGFRLQGGGWYETDFKTDNQRNLASKDKDDNKVDKAGKDDKAAGGGDQKAGKGDKAAKSADKPVGAGDKSASGAPGGKADSTGAGTAS